LGFWVNPQGSKYLRKSKSKEKGGIAGSSGNRDSTSSNGKGRHWYEQGKTWAFRKGSSGRSGITLTKTREGSESARNDRSAYEKRSQTKRGGEEQLAWKRKILRKGVNLIFREPQSIKPRGGVKTHRNWIGGREKK